MRRSALLAVLVSGVLVPAGIGAQSVAAASAPAPRVTSLSASSGPLVGREHLTVHGTGFSHVHTVLFGSAKAHVVRATATALVVVVPKHKAGRVDVRVITGVGETSKVKRDRFTYVAPPAATSLQPASGSVAGGTRVIVHGKGFTHVKAIMFGHAKGTHLHVASGKSLSVTAPSHLPGDVDVRVVTAYGTSKAVKADRFRYSGPLPGIPPVTPGPPPAAPSAPPLAVSPVQLPPVAAGVPYTPVTLTATAGTPPYVWSAHLLPGGLTLSPDGTLSGTTLATAGPKSVQLTVSDAAGASATLTTQLTVAPSTSNQLYDFGPNQNGTLGDGTTIEHDVAKSVPGMSGVVSICGNFLDTFATTADGGLWGWGDDTHGELGDGTATQSNMPRTSPVKLPGLTGAAAVACGDETGYALTSAGTVYSWGMGDQGQLGDNTASREVPVQIAGLTGVTAVAAAGSTGYAVRADGTVWAWGKGSEGELGDGTTTASRNTPGAVPGLTDIVSIAATHRGVYALRRDGRVSTWGGSNASVPLGDGGIAPRLTPYVIPELSGITQVASSGQNGYAVQDDGTLWSWGDNDGGQVGDGSQTSRTVPVRVFGLTNVEAVAATWTEAYAITGGGTVWSWGWGHNIAFSGIGGPSEYPAQLIPLEATWFTGITSFGTGGPDTFPLKKVHPIPPPPPVETRQPVDRPGTKR
jgi:alpha-tubulin suppressor-like RCC1 family protein